VEEGKPGSVCPTLIVHSDCDGEWSVEEARRLSRELDIVESRFAKMPPVPLPAGWKPAVAKMFGIAPSNLAECFFDVDGESLTRRLKDLIRSSMESGSPIVFQ